MQSFNRLFLLLLALIVASTIGLQETYTLPATKQITSDLMTNTTSTNTIFHPSRAHSQTHRKNPSTQALAEETNHSTASIPLQNITHLQESTAQPNDGDTKNSTTILWRRIRRASTRTNTRSRAHTKSKASPKHKSSRGSKRSRTSTKRGTPRTNTRTATRKTARTHTRIATRKRTRTDTDRDTRKGTRKSPRTKKTRMRTKTKITKTQTARPTTETLRSTTSESGQMSTGPDITLPVTTSATQTSTAPEVQTSTATTPETQSTTQEIQTTTTADVPTSTAPEIQSTTQGVQTSTAPGLQTSTATTPETHSTTQEIQTTTVDVPTSTAPETQNTTQEVQTSTTVTVEVQPSTTPEISTSTIPNGNIILTSTTTEMQTSTGPVLSTRPVPKACPSGNIIPFSIIMIEDEYTWMKFTHTESTSANETLMGRALSKPQETSQLMVNDNNVDERISNRVKSSSKGLNGNLSLTENKLIGLVAGSVAIISLLLFITGMSYRYIRSQKQHQ